MSYQLTTAKVWDGAAWVDAAGGLPDNFGPEVQYVVVAGGGGTDGLGGAGAGGYQSNVPGDTAPGGGISNGQIATLPLNTPTTITVGAGGSGASNGSNSVFGGIACYGGAHSNANSQGKDGGSGSGASSESAGHRFSSYTGFESQGFAGGDARGVSGVGSQGGGGGGAAEQGIDGDVYISNPKPDGGDGIASSITGSSVYRAGGGAGAGRYLGTGGLGGGGNPGANGAANTGGGAGAESAGSGPKNGGSGVVILKYPDAVTLTIGAGLTSSTSTSGGYKVTTFTAGTDTITATI